MQIHPTRATSHLAAAGALTMLAGLAAQQAAVFAWGGALLVGLAVARAGTELGVARIRAAGFEMLWRSEPRYRRIARDESLEIEAEVRNRDTRAARFVELRPVCSPNLRVSIEPSAGEVPAGGRLSVAVRVRGPRVGRHGIHGLSLEVRGGPGLFEVPLTFANPFGVDVMPRPYGVLSRSGRGGRNRLSAEAGRSGRFAGDGSELRELREHQPGDPFKRIAWKASARRGKLLVREYEQDEREIVWLLLDASIELWAGTPGSAPLDHAIDEVASVAERHASRGDRVGVGVVAGRTLAWIEPDRGPAHLAELMATLSHATAAYDADRSDWDEADVALRVYEHMRPLDPALVRGVVPGDLDRLLRRVERALPRAPFPDVGEPFAALRRERVLRRYLASFGVSAPARLEPERSRTDLQLAEALRRLGRARPRPSRIYVWSPAPDPAARPEIRRALLKHPRRRVDLLWIPMQHASSVPVGEGATARAVAAAVSLRVQVAEQRGEQALRGLGVAVHRPRRVVADRPEPPAAT